MESRQWSLLVQEKILKALQELHGTTWGYNPQDNLGLVADINSLTTMPQYEHLVIQKTRISAQGIEIQVVPEKTIPSLSKLTEAIHILLNAVDEDLFIMLPMLDTTTLKYWFVLGCATHGHIGEIVILRKDISHIDLSSIDSSL